MTPLSNDKTELKSRVGKMKLSGSTAGHIGTQWAWYMLSPNWGYLYPIGQPRRRLRHEHEEDRRADDRR